MLKYIFSISFLFIASLVASQSFTAKIIDANNNPIAFATVQTDENSGVISNEEGFFTINTNNDSIQNILISSLGFASKSISIEDIKTNNYLIILEEHINILDQVYLSNSVPDANKIIDNTNKNLSINYSNEKNKYNLFFRNSNYIDFSSLDFKVDKVSGQRKKHLEDANKALQGLTNSIKTSEMVYYRDYVADLYVQQKDSTKMDVYKATSLLDKKRSFSIEDIQEKAQRLLLSYLDSTKTYKLKSGLFKIEDSLSLKSEELKDEKETKQEYDIKNLKRESYNLLHKSQIYNNSLLVSILNSDLYNYEFIDTSSFDGKLVYIIGYSPRRSKAKYSGKLYITDENFAVIKLDYKYAKGKRGQKFNLKLLLGVKYIENINNGVILFERNQDSIYQPKYLKETVGRYFYVNRPLKLIENSLSKYKVGLNFKLEGITTSKNEMYFINNTKITDEEFNKITEKEKVEYQELKTYDPSIWAKYNALEPLEEMKNFKSIED